MAKETTAGRRFSRREGTTFDLTDPADRNALLSYMKAWARQPFKSWGQQVAEEVDRAKAWLSERGFPTHPRLALSESRGEWLAASEMPFDDAKAGCTLDVYVIEHAGCERDSSEHLAARFIVQAHEMQRPERERALEAAFRLGELNVLSRVYAAEIQGGRRAGSRPKRRQWADELAGYLVALHPKTRAQAFQMMPGPDAPLELDEDRHVYLDGETIVCADALSGAEKTLKWSSFERRYLAGHKRR